MSKKTILWLTLIGIVLAIIGAVLVVPVGASALQQCTQEQINNGTCQPTLSSDATTRLGIGIVLLGISALLHLIAWIGALVRSARMGSWAWFVVVLLISELGLILYALFAPRDRPKLPAGYVPAAGAPGYPPPISQPGYTPPGTPPPYNYPPPNYPSYDYPPPGTNYPQQGSGYPPNAPTVPG
ncbi:MAG TPA: hypothetical protein VH540_08715 [Ktedonobacterales bacterium]